jgi:hypothetical protein
VAKSRKHFYSTDHCFQGSTTRIIEEMNLIDKDQSNITEETQSSIPYSITTHRIEFLHANVMVVKQSREIVCRREVYLDHIRHKAASDTNLGSGED